jgi:hypothetical protein
MAKGKANEAAGAESEKARRAATHRTIPNRKTAISVTGVSATDANALAKFAGRYVFARAIGADITILRGAATVIAGEGLFITSGTTEELFVDPAGEMDLSHIGSGAGTLMLLDDDEIG